MDTCNNVGDSSGAVEENDAERLGRAAAHRAKDSAHHSLPLLRDSTGGFPGPQGEGRKILDSGYQSRSSSPSTTKRARDVELTVSDDDERDVGDDGTPPSSCSITTSVPIAAGDGDPRDFFLTPRRRFTRRTDENRRRRRRHEESTLLDAVRDDLPAISSTSSTTAPASLPRSALIVETGRGALEDGDLARRTEPDARLTPSTSRSRPPCHVVAVGLVARAAAHLLRRRVTYTP
ncbi:hypothetical protein FB107DRAFT_279226 [Schizophyllum commune]